MESCITLNQTDVRSDQNCLSNCCCFGSQSHAGQLWLGFHCIRRRWRVSSSAGGAESLLKHSQWGVLLFCTFPITDGKYYIPRMSLPLFITVFQFDTTARLWKQNHQSFSPKTNRFLPIMCEILISKCDFKYTTQRSIREITVPLNPMIHCKLMNRVCLPVFYIVILVYLNICIYI